MSLTVGYSSNNSIQSKHSNNVRQNANFAAAPVYNKSNNGKFDASEALKNLGKGVISPITGMFSSVKNFAFGTAMIAGTSVLMAATGGAIAPVLVASGVVMGGVQLVKAGIGIINAKNGDDVERSFYDIGGSASTLGLSALGAKSALSQASVKTDGIKTFGAVKKCFTSSKDLLIESFNVFKSGYYKTNLRTAFSVVKNPQNIRKYSEAVANEGSENFDLSYKALKDVLPDEFKPCLKGRSKCQVSIYEKMVKERNIIVSKIKTVKADASLDKAVKKDILKGLNDRLLGIDTDITKARALVEDAYGARLVIDSPKKMNKVVDALIEAVKKGDIEITEIENYHGCNSSYKGKNVAYLSKAQLKNLSHVCTAKIKTAPKNSGYTAVQLKVKPKNSKMMELQIRGSKIDTVGDWEHIPYDLGQKKDIAKGNNQLGIKLSDVKKAAASMSKEQKIEYNKYIYENYIYAQATEYGKSAQKPVLPSSINEKLSADNLAKLHSEISAYNPKTIRNPYDITPQSSLIASAESLKNELS